MTVFTIGPLGFYECDRMPFGLTNVPATFQQLMETCLWDLNLNWCIMYLDDIVIFSKDLASHLERLEAMFQKLEQAGLQLKLSRCELFWQQITYLGHIVSAQGIATDKSKIESIKKWPNITNVTKSDVFWDLPGIIGSLSQSLCRWLDPCMNWHQEKCGQEEGCNCLGWQVPAVLWWPKVPVHHGTYSCWHRLHQTV